MTTDRQDKTEVTDKKKKTLRHSLDTHQQFNKLKLTFKSSTAGHFFSEIDLWKTMK